MIHLLDSYYILMNLLIPWVDDVCMHMCGISLILLLLLSVATIACYNSDHYNSIGLLQLLPLLLFSHTHFLFLFHRIHTYVHVHMYVFMNVVYFL